MPWDPEFKTAFTNGSVEQIKNLMDKGADPNASRDEDSYTPLGYAVRLNMPLLVEAMVDHPNFKYTRNSNIALLLAIIHNHPEFLPLLLKKHSEDECSVDGWLFQTKTPCWLAEEKGYTDAVDLLKEHGAMPKPTSIPEDDLQISDEELGSGSYGTVYLGTLYNMIKVAVKTYNKKSNAVDEVIRVIKLQHPNIISYHGIRETPQTYNIVMEYMDNGDLSGYLKKHPRNNQTELFTVCRILLEIAQAIAYLHENRIIHLDIKGDNILLNQHLSAKLCDFNVSIKLGANNDISYFQEENVIRQVSRAYDILCLGIVLNMVSTENKCTEFTASRPCDRFRLLLDSAGEHLPALPAHTSTNVVNLIQWCIKEKPAERPNAGQVIAELQGIIQGSNSSLQ